MKLRLTTLITTLSIGSAQIALAEINSVAALESCLEQIRFHGAVTGSLKLYNWSYVEGTDGLPPFYTYAPRLELVTPDATYEINVPNLSFPQVASDLQGIMESRTPFYAARFPNGKVVLGMVHPSEDGQSPVCWHQELQGPVPVI